PRERARPGRAFSTSRELPPRASPVPGGAALSPAEAAPAARRQARARRRRSSQRRGHAASRLRAAATSPDLCELTLMTDIVLHHYAGSPFSEKVRLVLGMKRLHWLSVDVPVMLPKPDVVALTGGYRRTPFMQIGADVYCDSALMCRVIDRLPARPAPLPAATPGPAAM